MKKWLRRIAAYTLILLMVTSLFSVSPDMVTTAHAAAEKKVTGISLNKASTSIGVGKSVTLTATVSPENATNQAILWKSSDKQVATVSSTGKVIARGKGTATISAITEDGGFKATCKVTVQIAATGVKLNLTSKTLTAIGQKVTLKATVSPVDASNKAVTWKSSDASVAKVSSAGVVTAVKNGTATISAITKDGSHKATCKVTVAINKVTGVQLNISAKTLIVGSGLTLKATLSPANAANKDVTWKSSNSKVATVSSAGKVKAVAAGKATISVITVDGKKTAKCEITVKKAVADVWIPNSGSKYHSTSTCSNMKNPTKVTVDEAKSRGYTKCSKCW